jgi:hypothetical protein
MSQPAGPCLKADPLQHSRPVVQRGRQLGRLLPQRCLVLPPAQEGAQHLPQEAEALRKRAAVPLQALRAPECRPRCQCPPQQHAMAVRLRYCQHRGLHGGRLRAVVPALQSPAREHSRQQRSCALHPLRHKLSATLHSRRCTSPHSQRGGSAPASDSSRRSVLRSYQAAFKSRARPQRRKSPREGAGAEEPGGSDSGCVGEVVMSSPPAPPLQRAVQSALSRHTGQQLRLLALLPQHRG